MHRLKLLLAAALLALPAGADTPVSTDDMLPAEPNPQCSLLSVLVVARHDNICTTAQTTIMPVINAALERYVDYFERNGTQPRHAVEAEINAAILQPPPTDYDCATNPAGTFHSRFVADSVRLSTLVDFHLAEDRPTAMNVIGCFSDLRN